MRAEWSGFQKLVRPIDAAILKGQAWVDTFYRQSAGLWVVWLLLPAPGGTSMQTVRLLGGFRDASKARMIADTILVIARTDWPGMPIYTDFLRCPDVLAAFEEVTREADFVTAMRAGVLAKILSPLSRSELERLTAQVETLNTSVQDWKVMMLPFRGSKEPQMVFARSSGFEVLAQVPFGDALFRPKQQIYLDKRYEDVNPPKLERDEQKQNTFLSAKKLAFVESTMMRCDDVLAARYGAKPSAHLMLNHMRRNADQNRQMALYGMFGIAIVGLA